jgi:phosphoribosylamine--glycine ligase
LRILVIGSGGREHALVWKIAQSPLVGSGDLLCVPGNPGISASALCLPAPAAGTSDVQALATLARENAVDLVVVGPELPLTLGLADSLERQGIAVFGPSRDAARLEGSKVFAKEFMTRHGIPTAEYEVFSSSSAAVRYLASPERSFPIVVKADGLAAGKGVVVASSREEAATAVRAMIDERLHGPAGNRLVIEECLPGIEASFFAVTDGEQVVPLGSCQDFKRALDGDAGPNTGGMGACSPSVDAGPDLEATVLETVMRPAVRGLAREGCPYRGVLYAGLMLPPEGPARAIPRVLEFNVRFGDPEALVLLRRIDGDIVPLLLAAAGGRMAGPGGSVGFRPDWAACVVAATRGYPESSESGVPIEGIEAAATIEETVVFQAGTRPRRDGTAGVETAGGRVLAVSSTGPDLRTAIDRAYRGIDAIRFDGMHHRRDIGKAALERLARRTAAARRQGGA